MKNLVEYIDESLLDDEEDLLDDDSVTQTHWLRTNIKNACDELDFATDENSFKVIKDGNGYKIKPKSSQVNQLVIWLPDGKWPKNMSIDEKIVGLFIVSNKSKLDLNDLHGNKFSEISIGGEARGGYIKSIDMSKCNINFVRNFTAFCNRLETINLSGVDSMNWMDLANCRNIKIDGMKLPQICKYPKLPRELNDGFRKQLVKGTMIDPNSISFG